MVKTALVAVGTAEEATATAVEARETVEVGTAEAAAEMARVVAVMAKEGSAEPRPAKQAEEAMTAAAVG